MTFYPFMLMITGSLDTCYASQLVLASVSDRPCKPLFSPADSSSLRAGSGRIKTCPSDSPRHSGGCGGVVRDKRTV